MSVGKIDFLSYDKGVLYPITISDAVYLMDGESLTSVLDKIKNNIIEQAQISGGLSTPNINISNNSINGGQLYLETSDSDECCTWLVLGNNSDLEDDNNSYGKICLWSKYSNYYVDIVASKYIYDNYEYKFANIDLEKYEDLCFCPSESGIIIKPDHIELTPQVEGANIIRYGGYIDFHHIDNIGKDYTSRIIELKEGILEINGTPFDNNDNNTVVATQSILPNTSTIWIE